VNKIYTDRNKFNFKPPYGGDDYLNIKIDGQWLDELLDNLYPDNYIICTIPTLSFRMETDIEESIVRKRFLPGLNEKLIGPILMCPDDLDFECTLVVAEIERTIDTVIWNRIGIDKSETYDNKSCVGTNVNWLKPQRKFIFDLKDYLNVISNFEIEYEIQKNLYKEYNDRSFK
jgi:hypothetical protein